VKCNDLLLVIRYVTHAVTLNLPLDIEHLLYIKFHVIKVFTEFERNQAIPCWVIDNQF